MSKFTTALISVILALIIALWYSHARIGKLNADVKEITMIANDQKNALEDMQRQRVKAADFDIKITKELANAKNDTEHLRTELSRGTKRVYINATCPKVHKSTPATSRTHAARARLDDADKSAFLNLTERAKRSKAIIDGLQEYINMNYKK
jgi:prophage endopeptidase